MNKKMIAMIITVLIVISIFPFQSTNAVDSAQEAVLSQLIELSKTSGYRAGDDTGKNGQCWYFPDDVSKKIFGVGIPGGTAGRYRLSDAPNKNWSEVGSVYGTTATRTSVVELLKKSSPGDIIQFSNSLKSTEYYKHTMMVFNKDDSGITFYHRNSKGVFISTYAWNKVFTSTATPWLGVFDTINELFGLTVYHCTSYNAVATSNPSANTPTTNNAPTVTTGGIEYLINNDIKLNAQISGYRTSSGFLWGISEIEVKNAKQSTATKYYNGVWWNLIKETNSGITYKFLTESDAPSTMKLESGKQYWYKAFAVGADGNIVYGEVKSFTTKGTSDNATNVTITVSDAYLTMDTYTNFDIEVKNPKNESVSKVWYELTPNSGTTVKRDIVSNQATVSLCVLARDLSANTTYTVKVKALVGTKEVESRPITFTTLKIDSVSKNMKLNRDVNGKKEPYEDSSITKAMKKDQSVKIVAQTYNKHGNLWYKTDSGDWLFNEHVTPIDATVTSITISKNPDKTTYTVSEQLDTKGLTLKATYSDGSVVDNIENGFSCSPTSWTTTGTKTITVTYSGKTTTFYVTVSEATLSSITIKTLPSKTSYTVKEILNTSGLVLTAQYSDNTTKDVTSGFTCSPTSWTTAGMKTIAVTYSGKTTTFTVTVSEDTPTVITGDARSITDNNATINGSVSGSVTSCGFNFGTEQYTMTSVITFTTGSLTSYSMTCDMNRNTSMILQANTTYYYQSYAVGKDGKTYRGDIKTFTTTGVTPSPPTEKENVDYIIIKGERYNTNLSELWLGGKGLTNADIAPLKYMKNLQTLIIDGNNISDMSPLSSIKTLDSLNIAYNQISDISSLSSLANLRTLNLRGNNLSNITSLSSLTNLQNLYLAYNKISDISPLSSLTRLTSLDLLSNPITDISALASLKNLQELYIPMDNILDLGEALKYVSHVPNVGGMTIEQRNEWYP